MTDAVTARALMAIGTHPAGARIDSRQAPIRGDMDPQRLDKACRDMESIFLNQLLKEMRATIHESGLLTGGPGKSMYTSLMDSQLAADISKKGGVGLAQVLKAQLSADELSGPAEIKTQEIRGLADDSIE